MAQRDPEALTTEEHGELARLRLEVKQLRRDGCFWLPCSTCSVRVVGWATSGNINRRLALAEL